MLNTNKPGKAKWSTSTFTEITITPYNDAIETLRQLYEQELIECDHSYTEQVEVDDTRWLEPDGVHERGNEDETRCIICGAVYNPKEETWEKE